MAKVLITGTHFTPAHAVIEVLQQKPGWKIVYVGRNSTREGDSSQSVESQLLPKMGVKFYSLIAGRLQRRFTFYTIPSLLKIPMGFIQAFFILLKERPNVVLSFGGYVSVPVVIMAWLLSIPIMVHEQTLVNGLANQISSVFASKIAISFPNHQGSQKVILTGNPIRKEILTPSAISTELHQFFKLADQAKKPVIFITGGNQGSHIINQTILEGLDDLTQIGFIIHQTGDSKFKDFESLQTADIKNPERYLAKKWIDVEEMGNILKKADLMVGRAGANTLLELAYWGVPTLVIPLPFLYQDEQNKNAQYFKELGLVEVLPQSQLTAKKLISTLEEMLKHIPQLTKQAQVAKKIVIQDSAHRIALEVGLLT